jgi:hypothetical protein
MCRKSTLVAHFALLIGIGVAILVLHVMLNPENESSGSYLFGSICGFLGGILWSVTCTCWAWWSQLTTAQRERLQNPWCIGYALKWAGLPATISLSFALVGIIAVSAIPYVQEDVDVNLYQVIPQLALIGYYVGVWLCLWRSSLCGERESSRDGIPPREPEPVVVGEMV